MTSILESMGYIQQQGEAGKKKGLLSLLGQSFGADPAQRQQILSTVAQRGGADMAFDAEKHFSGMDDAARKRLGQYASVFSALPPEQKAAAYPQLAEMGRSLGLPVPQGGYQPAYDAGISKLGQALGSTATSSNVQSAFKGKNGNMWVLTRDGQVKDTGTAFDPNMQVFDAGDGIVAVNKTNATAQPITMAPSAGYTIDPSLPPEVQADIRANEPAYAATPDGGNRQIGPQLRKAPPEITPYQQAELDMSRQRLQAAQDARDQAASARKSADEVKAQQKRQTEIQRQSAAVESAGMLLDAIDQLQASPGYKALGTAWGDTQINTPIVRNDAKDARAQLKTISGQIALTTMNRLKALSSQGATGFGALSAPELKLLENSLAALNSEDISNAQLGRSLKVIREAMDKIAKWSPAQTAPQQAPASSGGLSPAEQAELDQLRAHFGRK